MCVCVLLTPLNYLDDVYVSQSTYWLQMAIANALRQNEKRQREILIAKHFNKVCKQRSNGLINDSV